jgi:cytochrome c nitrite reductase small subunit
MLPRRGTALVSDSASRPRLSVWLQLLLASLLGGTLGLGAFTFVYAEGYSYFSDDPAACRNCHAMQGVFDGWSNGSHKPTVVCNDCHTPHTFPAKYVIKALNGWNHSVAFTTGGFPDPIRIRDLNRQVALRNCYECHAELVVSIGEETHAEPVDCLTCHAGVGHRR